MPMSADRDGNLGNEIPEFIPDYEEKPEPKIDQDSLAESGGGDAGAIIQS